MNKNIEGYPDHVDINFGVDFEVARDFLNMIAGRAFRQYYAAKQMQKPEKEVAELREAYIAKHEEYIQLRYTDTAKIQTILAGSPTRAIAD